MAKKFYASIGAIAVALALAACGSGQGGDEQASGDGTEASSDDPITLGFAIGETGFMQPYDVPTRRAAIFAMKDINADGGVDGRMLEHVSSNTKSQANLAGDAATAVLDEGADIVITACDFDQGAPAATVAQNEGALAFSPCAASTLFGPQGIGPLAFTEATAAPAEGAAMAEWAYEDKGYRTAYTLLDDTAEFQKQSMYGFEERWPQLGGEIVGSDTFKQQDASINSQINNIKNLPEEPDVIYLASIMPGEASAIKQIRAAGIDAPILGDENIDGDFWKGAVPNLSDVYYATYASIYGDDPDEKVNSLVQRYEDSVGKAPDASTFVTGYAMVEAIAQAIRDAGGSTDGTALQEALEGFEDEDFLLTTTFTPEFHITTKRKLRIMQIEGGNSSLVDEWMPSEVPTPAG